METTRHTIQGAVWVPSLPTVLVGLPKRQMRQVILRSSLMFTINSKLPSVNEKSAISETLTNFQLQR